MGETNKGCLETLWLQIRLALEMEHCREFSGDLLAAREGFLVLKAGSRGTMFVLEDLQAYR